MCVREEGYSLRLRGRGSVVSKWGTGSKMQGLYARQQVELSMCHL